MYDTKLLILHYGIWHFSLQYLKGRYVAEHFVTQEQTDVHFSGFINTVFWLSLLLFSRFTGCFCNMQNRTCIRGGTCGLGLHYNVSSRLEGHLRSKWSFRLQCLHSNLLLTCGAFLSHVPLNFWRSLERAEHSAEHWASLLARAAPEGLGPVISCWMSSANLAVLCADRHYHLQHRQIIK